MYKSNHPKYPSPSIQGQLGWINPKAFGDECRSETYTLEANSSLTHPIRYNLKACRVQNHGLLQPIEEILENGQPRKTLVN
jgi:hypothetical protein